MGLDYLADDKRFVYAAALTATWGTIFGFELIRRKFRAMFAVSGAATAFLAYEAHKQFKAHIAFHDAKNNHDNIQNKRIALIAQTQKLVPISDQEHVAQINRIRELLDNDLIPYIITVNDFTSLDKAIRETAQKNSIDAFWIRSPFSEQHMYLSYNEIEPICRLTTLIEKELKSDTPVIFDRDYGVLYYSHTGSSNTQVLTGRGSLSAALANSKTKQTTVNSQNKV